MKKSPIKDSDIKTLKWVYTLCKGQMPMVCTLIGLNAIHGVISVFYATFSKNIIDGATVSKDMSVVIKAGLALLGLTVLLSGMNIVECYLAERCSAKLDITIKRHMIRGIMDRDYSGVTAYHTGDIHNRIFNDVNVVSNGFVTIIPNASFHLTKLISSIIYLVIINKFFALVFIVGGLFVFAFAALIRKKTKKLHKKVQEAEGKTRSFTQEVLQNLLVMKAFSVEDKVENAAAELLDNNYKTRLRRRLFSLFANTGLGFGYSLAMVFTLGFGAYGILHQTMTYGTVTALVQLVGQVQTPVVNLTGIFPQYFAVIASAERLIEIDSIPYEETANEATFDAADTYKKLKAINIDGVTFKYDRDDILSDTSLQINKGDFVAVAGISGIGKSTILKLLLGVFRPQQGNIYLSLQNGEMPIDKNTRRLFSYVPQGNMLVSGTIRDNLLFINENATDEEIEQAIEISCSKQFISELPDGIDTVIGEKGLGLSEGQTQRLAIARSLLSKAPVLLLDEATSALDEATEKQFLTNLKELRDITCIIVSHKKAALEICDKQIMIENQKIICKEG